MLEGQALTPAFNALLENLPEECNDTAFIALLGALFIHRGSSRLWNEEEYKKRVYQFGATIGDLHGRPEITMPWMATGRAN
jgi:hypothetical protein